MENPFISLESWIPPDYWYDELIYRWGSQLGDYEDGGHGECNVLGRGYSDGTDVGDGNGGGINDNFPTVNLIQYW